MLYYELTKYYMAPLRPKVDNDCRDSTQILRRRNLDFRFHVSSSRLLFTCRKIKQIHEVHNLLN